MNKKIFALTFLVFSVGSFCSALEKGSYLGNVMKVTNPEGFCGASQYSMVFGGYDNQGKILSTCLDNVDPNVTAVKCLLPATKMTKDNRIYAILLKASKFPWAVVTADETGLVTDILVDCRQAR